MTSALRSFLTYARYRGEVTLDLAAAVPVVANWSMPSIPRAISVDQVHQLLASIDRRTAVGLRDYAILLLLARLGLRSSEVAFLKLEDIDWNAGTVSVHGKSSLRNVISFVPRGWKSDLNISSGWAAIQQQSPCIFARQGSYLVDFEVPVALDQSFVIHSSVPESMRLLTEHINFAMD